MKSLLTLLIALSICIIAEGQVTVIGAVSGNGTYASLTNASGAFAAINASGQPGANITITITGDVTTETGETSLNEGTWSSLTIKPGGGQARTISGTMDNIPLINLNGADNVFIDGLNSGGNSLTITNLSTALGSSTINLHSDATYNTIINTTILGSAVNIIFGAAVTTGNDNNTISFCKIGPAGTHSPFYGILSSGSSTVTNSNITISNCEIYDFYSTDNNCGGIVAWSGNTDWTIKNNKIYQTSSLSFYDYITIWGIYFYNSELGNNVQITGNTIGYTSNSGTGSLTIVGNANSVDFYGIYVAAPLTSGSSSISNNIISNISMTGSSGVFSGIACFDANPIDINGNTIRNLTLNMSGSEYGIFTRNSSVLTVADNMITNISIGANAFAGIYWGLGVQNATATGNTISNLNSSSSGIPTAISDHSSSGNKIIRNNLINNLSTTSGGILGIFVQSTSAPNPMEISGNIINTFSGGIYQKGISIQTSSVIANIFKNKIYDLSTSNSDPTIFGIYHASGITTNIYNNIIGDLRTSAANSANPMAGIYLLGGTTNNLYYNTVYLNTSSSGANFGSSCIYTNTTAMLDMRNNILVNTSAANGNGLTCVYQRNGTNLTTYSDASNNNLFYAGAPTANKLIFFDGTNADVTLAAYKTRVAARDAASVTENPAWISTIGSNANFLHINTSIPTQIESGGTPVVGYNYDFDGDTRDVVKPDVGADEFAGLNSPPIVSYTTLSNTNATTNRILTATISDFADGVPQSGAGRPMLYWKINSGSYSGVQGVWVSGNTYTFTFGAGVVLGNVVYYYIAAQDNAVSPNVGCTPSSGAGGFSSNPPSASTPPTSPESYFIINPICGSYTVGVGKNYSTLTAAVADYNSREITCATNFILTDASYPSETFPIVINQILGTSPTNTLTIKPASGVATTISGTIASNSLITLNGADNIIIDGINSGGSSLTLSNLSTSATAGTSTLKLIADASGNIITNCTILGSSTAPLSIDGGNVLVSSGTTTGNDNNTLSNCKIGPAGTNLPSKGVFGNGSSINSIIANSNCTINNCEIYDFFLTGGCAGIYATTGNANWTVSNNKIYQTASRTFTGAGTMTGIYFSNPTYGDGVQITGNTIGYSSNAGAGTLTLLGSVAGAFQGIYFSTQPTAITASNVNNNIISDFSFTSTTGAFYGINNATSASANIVNINGNTVRNLATITTTGNIYGIYTGSATTLSASSNTVNAITRTGSGLIYGIYLVSPATASVNLNIISNIGLNNTGTTTSVYGIYDVGCVNLSATGNTITNLTTTATGAAKLYGIWEGSSASGNKVIQNNTINGFSAAGGASIYGIYTSCISVPNPIDIGGNLLSGFSGGLNEYGIQQASALSASTIYKNKIYNLYTTNVNPTVNGISLSGGTTNTLYNNIIGDLRATAANAAVPLAGIYVSGGTTNNIYFNTVYLNATSSGTNFGSTCIYASTTPIADLRDNVLVNTSTPNGTGYACAYRRSSASLSSYASTSNFNLFYCGTPGPSRLVFYDGSNSDQTMAAFKSRVSPRDDASVTENPIWVSTSGGDASFLHINSSTATQIESGGSPVSAVPNDFDGEIRNITRPDIGADEFSGVGLDISPPVITYTPFLNTATPGSRTLTAVINDYYNGVPQSGSGLPMLYWKKNNGSYSGVHGVWISGNTYSFTFGVGTVNGDAISYYIVAQDQASTTNVGCFPSTGASGFGSNPPTVSIPPASPNSYKIISLCGTINVGAGQLYSTLTEAVSDLNSRDITCPLTLLLTDGTYPSETFPIVINPNAGMNQTNTLTIKPATGVAVVLSGTVSANSLLTLNGADFITIDGLNTGGSSLTLSNLSTSASAGTCSLKLISDATNNTIRNCSILGSSTVPLATDGGTVFFSTGFATGNDNNTIANCKIGPAGANLPSKGIYGNGSTTNTTMANSNITINGCDVYDFFLSGGCAGIYSITGNTGWIITNNKIYETASRTFTASGSLTGIYFSNGTDGDNIQITGNTIGYSGNSGTGILTLLGGSFTGDFNGVYFAGSTSGTGTNNISNNIISDISNSARYGTLNGIYIWSGASMNINTNTVRNISIANTYNNSVGICVYGTSVQSVTGNTINNIITIGTGSVWGILSSVSGIGTFNQNTISNLAMNNVSTSALIYGMSINGSGFTVSDNFIFNLTTTSTSSFSVCGISSGGSSEGNKSIRNNTIYSLTGPSGAGNFKGITESSTFAYSAVEISGNILNTFSGGSVIHGLSISSASQKTSVFKNKVFDLASANASSQIYGMYLNGGTSNYIYNNIIGDLRSTAANVVLSLAGIYVDGGSSNSIYSNTVYLNGSSTGTNFGSACIYANTTPPLDLRNNILVNSSTPNGTGRTCAYQRSSTALTTFAPSSDNNLFYAGTPSSSRLIFYDGTNADQTLSAYQSRVSPREAVSVTENPSWSSTAGSNLQFLHINPSVSTLIESGGSVNTILTDDFDGDSRNIHATDIGADEFSGISPRPLIVLNSINPPGNLCSTAARTISVDATTPSGTINGVTISYNNGTATGPVSMTNTSGNTWVYTIPSANPSNVAVTWSVKATSSVSVSSVCSGTYQDDPLKGVTTSATSSVSLVCSGNPTELSVALARPGNSEQIYPGYNEISTINSYPSAFANYYYQTWQQIVFTAAELHAAGLTAGYLTGLQFNVAEVYLPATAANYSISLSTTTAASLTTFTSSGLTQVYYNPLYPFSVGWNNLPFSTPYNWDGASNLLVDIRIDGNKSGNAKTFYTTSSAHSSVWAASYNTNNPSFFNSNPGAIAVNARPNVIFSGNTVFTPASYSWSDGSTVVGTTNPLNVSPTQTSTYTCTSSANGCQVVSNAVNVNVLAPVIITSQPAASVKCSGENASFSILASGTNLTYQWRKNGSPISVGNNASAGTPTFSLNNVSADDAAIYDVIMTSDCGGPLTSNGLSTLTVNPVLPVSVSIGASANPVVAGTQVIYTATAGNGGAAPVYQWRVNSVNAGTNNPIFTYVPTNNDTITCMLTSDASCTTNNPATSAVAIMTVDPVILSVTPGNQNVSELSGTTSFEITSNTTWTAISDQAWCEVTPSGELGNRTIIANFTENMTTDPRITTITVSAQGLPPVIVTVTQSGVSDKTVNMVMFLEGLYAGSGLMRPAMDENGVHWGETIADKITIELHNSTDYPTIIKTISNVDLLTNGTASFTVPGTLRGNYYITILHRNTITTTTAAPVSFALGTITYDFTDMVSKAYGNNMAMMIDGKYVLYGGEAMQDGLIDGTDLSMVDNDASGFTSGYLQADINGDGLVDGTDLSVVDNNSAGFVSSSLP